MAATQPGSNGVLMSVGSEFGTAAMSVRCWPPRSDRGSRWSSRLVATAAVGIAVQRQAVWPLARSLMPEAVALGHSCLALPAELPAMRSFPSKKSPALRRRRPRGRGKGRSGYAYAVRTHLASSARYSASPAIRPVTRSVDALPKTKHLPRGALSRLGIHGGLGQAQK